MIPVSRCAVLLSVYVCMQACKKACSAAYVAAKEAEGGNVLVPQWFRASGRPRDDDRE